MEEYLQAGNNYIILYFGDQWDDSWRRRQQLAYRLSKRSKVAKLIYIEFPLPLTSLVKFFLNRADNDAKQRWKRVFKYGLTSNYKKVIIFTPISLFPIFQQVFFFKLAYFFWVNVTGFLLYRILRKYSNLDVLFWGSHPYANDFLRKFKEQFICYDYTERFEEFEDHETEIRDFFHDRDKEMSKNATIVLTQTIVSYNEKKGFNPNVYIVPNAIDENVFLVKQNKIPEDFNKLRKPVIGYIGGLNYRLDYKLLESLAKRFAHCSLIFIGLNANNTPKAQLYNCENVIFVKGKPYDLIQSCLEYFDVCLIPFKVNRLTETESPIKLYDYLASGKPIVSTNIPGVSAFSSIVYIAKTEEDFLNKVDLAINENNSTLNAKRKEIARINTWNNRIYEILQMISTHGGLDLGE